MSDIKRVGDAGIYTQEGNVAGGRAALLTKEREKQRLEYEEQKNKLKAQNATDVRQINAKFSIASDGAENDFRRRTVGLVSAEDFRKAREDGEKQEKLDADRASEEHKKQQAEDEQIRQEERDRKRRKLSATLSFGGDDDEEQEIAIRPRAKKSLKDPTVDTSFLPDADRERKIALKREELKKEWLEQQERVKNEDLEVVYSYWDGSGHRRVLRLKKGSTIGKFLELAKQQLVGEFKELRSTNSEDLLYVKEDLIIPQHLSFYDLIVTKARGKSGPLFHFDVHEDVRMVSDATVEKEESHPGKIVERRWYERNKHIFPASRWELFDPTKARDQVGYTIHGDA
jgi:protein FAM50